VLYIGLVCTNYLKKRWFHWKEKGDIMKISPTALIIVLVFAAVLGVGMLGGGLTGQASGSALPITNGTVLSVIAAVIAIGVLIVAGLNQGKN